MGIVYIDDHRPLGRINKDIYGQFSEHLGRCIYGGLWVGPESDIPNVNGIRSDVVAALKDIHVPVLRWPGGCFADEYHWQDGIGPNDQRKTMVNNNWGGVTENNHFGTHEYFELLRQIGAAAYINGNVGSGTVQEMQEWVEYMTMNGTSPMADRRAQNGHPDPWPVKYFGVGNESWGCGGNMRPAYYADLYRRYQTFVRNYDPQHPLTKIACGPNNDDYHWTDEVMKSAGPYLDGISLHHYALPHQTWSGKKGSATGFPADEWVSLMADAEKMDELITRHSAIMDKYDPDKKKSLVVDEWGAWYDVEPGTNPGFLYQQNTIRDACVAALALHIFQHHVDRVHLANIAQMVNVLQAMILTDGDQMVKTPTYYVFKMFLAHQDATALDTVDDLPATVTTSVSAKGGGYLLSLVNYGLDAAADVRYEFQTHTVQSAAGEILHSAAMDAHNDFTAPDTVVPEPLTTGLTHDAHSVSVTIPPMSVVTVHVR
ncbi:alpha-N-arabinofuranosidase [Schleiferilactobacillus shenzhenensis]|uniref:non-reducing end alpha-L-arabinofuranosidase n=1 Tax=Schleiferilactobacillus shenzhenensis LY-73 TaxID=1231336 RepID=U4TP56_9LACO|nr:alpha-L-arabinofuranosidase C-terminal domain-containing protein [Schleiferilactobacillus shenzhenensis]ERL63683.1 Xsa [Schleiferilactobacillus shenzhenensis LY-73]